MTIGPTFASLLTESFDQIRSNAKDNLAIILRMLDAFQTLSSLTTNPNHRQALREQVRLIVGLAERTVESAHDHARIDTRLTRVRETLEAEPALCAGKEKTN
jgi:uncharacterized membrane protein